MNKKSKNSTNDEVDKKSDNSANKSKHKIKINEHIVNKSVRILDADKRPSEAMSKESALQLARDQNLDLVLKDEKEGICIICDSGKYLYDLEKRKKDNKQSTSKNKDFSFGVKIQDRDIQIKIKNIKNTLKSGNSVAIKMFVPSKKREDEEYKKTCLIKLRTIIEMIKADEESSKPIKVMENPTDLSAAISRPKDEGSSKPIKATENPTDLSAATNHSTNEGSSKLTKVTENSAINRRK